MAYKNEIVNFCFSYKLVEFGEAQIQTGKLCTDPNGKDIKSECFGYCTDIGFLGGSCQGYKNHYMCKCYVG